MLLFLPLVVPLLVRSRLHAEVSQEKRKNARSIIHFHVPLIYMMSRFGEYVDRISFIELEIKDITDTARSAACLDIHIEISSERLFRAKLYDNFSHYEHSIYI